MLLADSQLISMLISLDVDEVDNAHVHDDTKSYTYLHVEIV